MLTSTSFFYSDALKAFRDWPVRADERPGPCPVPSPASAGAGEEAAEPSPSHSPVKSESEHPPQPIAEPSEPSQLAIEDAPPAEPLKETLQDEGPCENKVPNEKSYEQGFDASQGRAWRKEILGAVRRGPLEWSQPTTPDPSKKLLDAIECHFDDGMSIIVPHMTQVAWCNQILLLSYLFS